MFIDKRAYTLVELLFASVIIVILFATVFGAFVVTKSIFQSSMAEYNLQRDVDLLFDRIIKGKLETGGAHGLRSAVSYTLPVTTKIDFVGADGATREYYFDVNSNSMKYNNSLTTSTIYTFPAGSTITVRFWNPYMDLETVGMYISFSQVVAKRTVSGSLSTYVTLRALKK